MTDLARLIHGNPLARAERRLPDFVTRRMNAHYVDRLHAVWGGDHTVAFAATISTQPSPSTSAATIACGLPPMK